ncbi:MAG: phage holin family protein [Thermoleophilaceae bacterium]
MTGNGAPPPGSAEKSLGDVVGDVSQKASLLVREEIELAKAEISEKVSSLAKGGIVAAAAGIFAVFGLIYLFEGLAWFFDDLLDVGQAIWVGFLIVFGILIVLAGMAGMLGLRWIKRGSPPTPKLAIEEAKRTRAELSGTTN